MLPYVREYDAAYSFYVLTVCMVNYLCSLPIYPHVITNIFAVPPYSISVLFYLPVPHLCFSSVDILYDSQHTPMTGDNLMVGAWHYNKIYKMKYKIYIYFCFVFVDCILHLDYVSSSRMTQ